MLPKYKQAKERKIRNIFALIKKFVTPWIKKTLLVQNPYFWDPQLAVSLVKILQFLNHF